jgi:hypothetical protein
VLFVLDGLYREIGCGRRLRITQIKPLADRTAVCQRADDATKLVPKLFKEMCGRIVHTTLLEDGESIAI